MQRDQSSLASARCPAVGSIVGPWKSCNPRFPLWHCRCQAMCHAIVADVRDVKQDGRKEAERLQETGLSSVSLSHEINAVLHKYAGARARRQRFPHAG